MTEVQLLNIAERDTLIDCEIAIERGLQTFVEVGQALLRIRDERLYTEWGTFENYLDQRWQMSRPRAYELINAAGVVSAIADRAPDMMPPQNEGQARALGRVPEEERAEVWSKVVDITDGKPTAAAIRETYAPPPPVAVEPFRFPEPDELPEGLDPAAVDRYAEATVKQQNTSYMHEFLKALCRADDFLSFDAERVGRLANADEASSLADYAKSIQDFCAHFAQSRSGLHLVSGGRS